MMMQQRGVLIAAVALVVFVLGAFIYTSAPRSSDTHTTFDNLSKQLQAQRTFAKNDLEISNSKLLSTMEDMKNTIVQSIKESASNNVQAPQLVMPANPYQTVQNLKNRPDHVLRLHASMKHMFVSNFKNIGAGCADFAGIYPMMSVLYKGNDKTGFIDIGSNVGHTSSDIMQYFSKIDYRILLKDNPELQKHVVCQESPHYPKVVAVEAMPSVYKDLMKRAKKSRWQEFKWTGINNAAVGPDDPEEITMSGDGRKELFKIVKKGEELKESATVKTITVDNLVKKYLDDVNEIFLLKIDAEGYDPKVLSGADKTLKSGKVRFIHFEYNSIWTTGSPEWSLKKVQAFLYERGYFCWFLMDNLIPISSEWWDDKYEVFDWSNVFAARIDDNEWPRIVQMLNKYDFKL